MRCLKMCSEKRICKFSQGSSRLNELQNFCLGNKRNFEQSHFNFIAEATYRGVNLN